MNYCMLLQAQISDSNNIPFVRGCREFTTKGKTMKFPCDVYSILELESKIIIGMDVDQLAEILPKNESDRAVFCYDLEGNVLWQVDYPYYINPETGKKVICNHGEDAIQRVRYWEDEKKLVVFGTMGYECDPETGKLGAIVWQER